MRTYFRLALDVTGKLQIIQTANFSILVKRLNDSPELLSGLDLHDPNVLDEFGKPSLITQHGTVRSGFKEAL